MHSGDGWTRMWMYLKLLTGSLKRVKMVNFMFVCLFFNEWTKAKIYQSCRKVNKWQVIFIYMMVYMFKITNYQTGSHSISNTRSNFSPGPRIRRRGLRMNHKCSEGLFKAAQQHQLCPKESAHLWSAKKCLIPVPQQNFRYKAIHEKISMFLEF